MSVLTSSVSILIHANGYNLYHKNMRHFTATYLLVIYKVKLKTVESLSADRTTNCLIWLISTVKIV